MPVARTVAGLLNEMAERFPERDALIDATRRYTYRELNAAAETVARGLYAQGVRPGDHVAILMGNVAEWLVVDFAIAKLGATMVSVNTWVTKPELQYLLDHSDARVLVMQPRFLNIDYVALLEEIRADGTWPHRLEQVVCLGAGPDWTTPYSALLERSKEADAAPIAALTNAVDPQDTACLLYTSGSTSRPKGVVLEHYALIENMWGIGERQRLTEQDRLWLAVSLFWGLGCENALFAIMTHGGCMVLQESFEAGEALRLLEEERCTVYYGTPNMTLALLEHPDRSRRDLSALRTGVTIGSPEQLRMAMTLGAHAICNVYGMTETYANASVVDANESADRRATSVGPALPGNEIRIVDPESGRLLPQGEVGEIRVRGYVTPSYYKDPEKTAASFDDDGFFLTGDLGFLDDQGHLHFRGRHKEMIKTGGINVAPVEVEEVLAAHPGVAQVYVVGLPDPERDEIVAAVIVPSDPEAPPDTSDLHAFCRERMAAYKVLRRYRFADDTELPLTSTRKLQKLRLPELF